MVYNLGLYDGIGYTNSKGQCNLDITFWLTGGRNYIWYANNHTICEAATDASTGEVLLNKEGHWYGICAPPAARPIGEFNGTMSEHEDVLQRSMLRSRQRDIPEK